VVVATAVVATAVVATVVAVTETAVLVVAETEALSMDRATTVGAAMVVEAVAAVVMEEAANMVEEVVAAVMVSCRNRRCSHHRCSCRLTRRPRYTARARSCYS
jgi:hypothetical protein